MKYEARLFAHEWINGTGWVSGEDEVESWDVKPEDVETWKQLIKSNDKSLFDYVVDTAEALSDGEEGDCQWTIKLVEIDEDDVFETGELIAETSIWESELNPNKRMKIAKIYTWYDFMDGHRFAPCCVRHFDKYPLRPLLRAGTRSDHHHPGRIPPQRERERRSASCPRERRREHHAYLRRRS